MRILNTSESAILHAFRLAMARRVYGPHPTPEQVGAMRPFSCGRPVVKGRQVGATLGLLAEAGALP